MVARFVSVVYIYIFYFTISWNNILYDIQYQVLPVDMLDYVSSYTVVRV
jgi:hypothetical protein